MRENAKVQITGGSGMIDYMKRHELYIKEMLGKNLNAEALEIFSNLMNGNNHVPKKADHDRNDCRFYGGGISACAVRARRTHGLIIGQLYRRDYWHMDWV